MAKFNYTDWVLKNKYGKTLKEDFTPDLEKDDLQRKAIKQMMDKEKMDKEADDAEQDEWDKGWYGESLKSLAEALGYITKKND